MDRKRFNLFQIALIVVLCTSIAQVTVNTINQAYFDGVVVGTGNLDLNGNDLIIDEDGDTKLYASADDKFTLYISGANRYEGDTTAFGSLNNTGGVLRRSGSSLTVPYIHSRQDFDTGVGGDADRLALVAGAVTGMLVTENTTIAITAYGVFDFGTAATITASTTQSQGQQALTNSINEVSVCANANDVVTVPAAVAGRRVVLINNGAQTLQIFPASGDDLGAGVNTSVTLAAGSNVEFVAYDVTNWEQL